MSLRILFVILVLVSISHMNLHSQTQPSNRFLGKHSSPFHVDSQVEIVNGQTGAVRIVMNLGTNLSFQKVHYKWILPVGAKMDYGTEEGDFINLDSVQMESFEIQISQLHLTQNQNVILMVESPDATKHQKLGSSFIIPTRGELTEEYKTIKRMQQEEEQVSSEIKARTGGDTVQPFSEDVVPPRPKKRFIY